MSKKTLQRYPKIIKYLEDHHSDLYDVIDALALYNAFTPKKGGGITFLLPVDNYRQSIIDATYGDNPDSAIKMLKSLIIVDILNSAADWDKKRDDIPNLLGQRLEVQNISANAVKLKSGATLRLDDSFKPMTSRTNMAIWIVSAGEVPINGPKASFKYIRGKKKTANKSGSDVSSSEPDQSRMDLAQKLEKSYDHPSDKRDRYLEYMAALMATIQDEEDKTLYARICPMLDASALVSFYLLVEPYKRDNDVDYIIPNYILNKVTRIPNVVEEWKSHFRNFSQHEMMLEEAQQARDRIGDEIGRGQLEKVAEEYAAFDEGKNMAEHFPKHAGQFYKDNPGMKKWQDGARHLIRKAFEQDPPTRNDMIQTMFDSYRPGKMNTIITDPSYYRGTSASIYNSLIGDFILSDLFMYFPHAPDIKLNGENSEDEDLINYSSMAWEEQEKVNANSSFSVGTMERQLRVLKKSNPAEYKRIMKKYQEQKETDEPAEQIE